MKFYDYPKAYTQVIEVLKYMPKESVNKIPKEVVETFKIKSDKDYYFEIDINKSLFEQNLLDETKAILRNIYRDYIATEDERELLFNIEIQERIELENEKLRKYNPDDLFKKPEEDKKEDNKTQEIIIKKESLFDKIINFFRNINIKHK